MLASDVNIYKTGQDTISGKMDHEVEVQKILTTCPNSSEKQQEVVVPGVCSSSSEKKQDMVVPGGCPNPSEKQQEMVVPGACPSPSEKQQEVVVPGACPSPSEKQQEVVEPDGCPSSTENQQEVVVPGHCPSSSEKQQKLAVPGGCPNFTENQQEVVVLGYWPSSSEMKQEVDVLGYLPSSEMNQEMEVQGYWPSSFEVHSDCAKSSEMLHEVEASSGNARSSEMQQEVEVLGNWLSSSGDSYCVILNENEELSLLKLVETEDEPMTDVSEDTQEMVPLNVGDIQEISGMHLESNGNPISVHPCSARNGTHVASDFNNQILLYEDYMESGCSTFRKTLQDLASSRELAPNFQSQPADPFGKQSITVRSQIVSPGVLVEPTNQIFLNGSCMQAGPSIKAEPMNEKLQNNRNLSCRAVVSSWDSSTDPSWNQVNMTSGNNKHDHPAVISAVPSDDITLHGPLNNIFHLPSAMDLSDLEVTIPASTEGEECSIIETSGSALTAAQSQPTDAMDPAQRKLITNKQIRQMNQRMYRQEISSKFTVLKQMLPALVGLQGATKPIILDAATDHIRALREELTRLRK